MAARSRKLSGVSGWGFPYGEKGSVSMIVRLHYADGKTEDHPLRNGVEFADYIRTVDVPGSKLAFTLHLEDGTAFGYLLNEFRDTDDGGDIILRVMFPAAAQDDMVDGHTEYFCIEFGHWVRDAMVDRGAVH